MQIYSGSAAALWSALNDQRQNQNELLTQSHRYGGDMLGVAICRLHVLLGA